ncbi:hypothetical protein NQ315_009907 [Exocentrus adspersus]|uniref:Methyltransferase-like protein 15 homolog n=1 Tax=Exocentrus adspersus TaxID=1586481 RepID=A0AAV8WIV6_9CUCU|nr:hypothetical protein NQ315_009907 [Exocentrus adspersus]
MLGAIRGTCSISSFIQIVKKLSTAVEKCVEERVPHIPVMVTEALTYLNPERDQVILDMTFGAGGHSRRILEAVGNIKLLALDRDPTAFEYAQKLAEEYPLQVTPLLGRFSELPSLLKAHNIKQNTIDGVLFDFGCSSMQFDEGERGFSVSKNGPLDMRMDKDRNPDAPTARDVLAKASEEDLYKIIKYYGEEKQARKIARAIADARYLFKSLSTTEELVDLVESVCTSDYRLDKLQRHSHVATKTFQALRIFVNNELNEINYGLILAHRYLKIGGRLVAITFHSLEDTIVKRHLSGNVIENVANPMPLKYSSHMTVASSELLQDLMDMNWKMLHKHVIVPGCEEVEVNPRSRSAKLRAAVKVK